MTDREKVIRGLEHCRKYGTLGGLDCNGHYEYTDNLQDIIKANNHRKDCLYGKCRTGCVVTLVDEALALLKEQEELLRKLQKDKDRLCLEVSEWKHKFYDAPPKFVPQGIVDQIVFERDTALSQLEQLGKGLGSTFLMRELSDNR